MKISVNIKVRNSLWYWTKEEIKESKKKNSMSRQEWELLNKSKVPKHVRFVDFDYKFDVKTFSENRNGLYNLIVYSSISEEIEDSKQKTVPIEDVTIIEFKGESERAHVVVSNDLIYQYIGAQKGKDGCLYWYFYLKENINCNMLTNNIWLSDIQVEKIYDQLKIEKNGIDNFAVEIDNNLKIRKLGSSFSIR